MRAVVGEREQEKVKKRWREELGRARELRVKVQQFFLWPEFARLGPAEILATPPISGQVAPRKIRALSLARTGSGMKTLVLVTAIQIGIFGMKSSIR
jgi:hypothetical protein